MTRTHLAAAIRLVVAPVHVGAASTLVHPVVDSASWWPLLYGATGLWLIACAVGHRKGVGLKWLYTAPLVLLLVVHLATHGRFTVAGDVLAGTFSPGTTTVVYDIPAPRAAPPLLPAVSVRALARVIVTVLTGTALFGARVLLGTPVLTWVVFIGVVVYLRRREA